MEQLDTRVLILGKDKPYQGREDDLQIALVDHLFYNYQTHVWYHVPNGGKRNAREAARFKRMGVVAGVSDLILDEPRGGYHGLRIELKAKKGKPTDSQIKFLNKSVDRGYLCAVCWSFDTATHLLKEYLKDGIHTKAEEKKVAAKAN